MQLCGPRILALMNLGCAWLTKLLGYWNNYMPISFISWFTGKTHIRWFTPKRRFVTATKAILGLCVADAIACLLEVTDFGLPLIATSRLLLNATSRLPLAASSSLPLAAALLRLFVVARLTLWCPARLRWLLRECRCHRSKPWTNWWCVLNQVASCFMPL